MNTEKKLKRIYSQQEREKLLYDYQNSGLAKTVWCNEHSICVSTLHKWIKTETTKKTMQVQN